MQFRGMEDRLNPLAPAGVDEGTLGGYAAIHGRAAAFEGSDGLAYTVGIEAEPAGAEGWTGYLVFLRWAAEGSVILGHLETEDLVRGTTREEVIHSLQEWPLHEVKRVLETEIERRRAWEREAAGEADAADSEPAE